MKIVFERMVYPMLKRFALKNYKNFRDKIEINFGRVAGYQFSADCISDGVLSKMLIYGRNATGKTNLGKAIMNIGSTMFAESRLIENGVFVYTPAILEREFVKKFRY